MMTEKSRAGRVSLALLLLLLASACASEIPVEDFRRLDLASFELQEISLRSESELEQFAFEALVAESRLEPTLSLEHLDPGARWSDLWVLVGARHAALDLVRSYLDLLVEWAQVSNEGAFGVLARGLRLSPTEEARVTGAARRVRASAERFEDALESVRGNGAAVEGARALALRSDAAVEEVLAGMGRNVTTERLWALMKSAHPDLEASVRVLVAIEEDVLEQIARMTHVVLDSYNAVRPPVFRSDRLAFDAQAILRVARAARIERLSAVLSESATLIPGAHAELWRKRVDSTSNGRGQLGRLEVLVERGPERVRNPPSPPPGAKHEAVQPAPEPTPPPEDPVEEAWKSWKGE